MDSTYYVSSLQKVPGHKSELPASSQGFPLSSQGFPLAHKASLSSLLP